MQFISIDSEAQVLDLVSGITNADLALDTETTDKDPRKADLLKIVLSFDGQTAYSIPAKFLPLLVNLKQAKRLRIQNFKYDYHVLYRHGLDLLEVSVVDPMLLHHLIDENSEHSLEYFCKTYYNDSYKEVFWDKYKKYEDASAEDALEYECKDAIYHYLIVDRFLDDLKGKEALIDHVHSLALALLRTEIRGIRVDVPLMQKTKEDLGGRIATYLPELRGLFSNECEEWELEKWSTELEKRKTTKGKALVPRPNFNFASNTQVQWLLYDKLGLPVKKKTQAGKPATDYETIEKLVDLCPRLKTYKDYIDIKTIYGTFVEGLLERVDEERIYPGFNVNGTVTGRISHSNPNMGNMPKEGVYRNFFLPDPGYRIIGADYSQLEVVIEAHVTGDKNLARIVMDGVSKHDITAEGLKIPRDVAKTVNFALGYHCGIKKLSKILACSYQEAEYQYNKYWEVYSGCRDLKLVTDSYVDMGQPLINLFGRQRRFPMKFAAEWHKEAAKRQAYNFMIQGPGGDFMNKAFYLAHKRFKKSGIGNMLWTVHDEAVGEAKIGREVEASHNLVQIMEDVPKEYNLKFPLKAQPYGPFERWQKA